jgi:hypothetical protein
LKQALEWGVLEKMPCSIRLVRVPRTDAAFHDFDDWVDVDIDDGRSGCGTLTGAANCSRQRTGAFVYRDDRCSIRHKHGALRERSYV